ncbi:hypothetical protein AYM40_23940 [Paraburkholderia phytofirmans OLGA172]|uniref:Uncharacterized protein n=1 Tax=Paraburkholderia phytofirmans OLGA172 TaxID=1417228 RepID=A0A167WB25_9BURK|nr:hypothetical protein AYM40_23940 [Paraburkholderia phytofirmans OLGA172]
MTVPRTAANRLKLKIQRTPEQVARKCRESRYGVACNGHVEAVLLANQRLHRIRRRWVHADTPIPIDTYEAEGRIDFVIDHAQVQTVAFGNRPPVVHAEHVGDQLLRHL